MFYGHPKGYKREEFLTTPYSYTEYNSWEDKIKKFKKLF